MPKVIYEIAGDDISEEELETFVNTLNSTYHTQESMAVKLLDERRIEFDSKYIEIVQEQFSKHFGLDYPDANIKKSDATIKKSPPPLPPKAKWQLNPPQGPNKEGLDNNALNPIMEELDRKGGKREEGKNEVKEKRAFKDFLRNFIDPEGPIKISNERLKDITSQYGDPKEFIKSYFDKNKGQVDPTIMRMTKDASEDISKKDTALADIRNALKEAYENDLKYGIESRVKKSDIKQPLLDEKSRSKEEPVNVQSAPTKHNKQQHKIQDIRKELATYGKKAKSMAEGLIKKAEHITKGTFSVAEGIIKGKNKGGPSK